MRSPVIGWGVVLAVSAAVLVAHNAWVAVHPGLRRERKHRVLRLAVGATGAVGAVMLLFHLLG